MKAIGELADQVIAVEQAHDKRTACLVRDCGCEQIGQHYKLGYSSVKQAVGFLLPAA